MPMQRKCFQKQLFSYRPSPYPRPIWYMESPMAPNFQEAKFSRFGHAEPPSSPTLGGCEEGVLLGGVLPACFFFLGIVFFLDFGLRRWLGITAEIIITTCSFHYCLGKPVVCCPMKECPKPEEGVISV